MEKTRVFFQMTKGDKTEVVKFVGSPSDADIEEYFESQCGGVYKWWRDPAQDTSGPTTY